MSALQQAKALHKLKKVYRRGLLKKHVQQSRLGTVAAAQDHYIIKIHLTTDKTGKKKIEFTPNLLINVPATNIAGPQHRDFMIKRTPNRAPYAKKPIKGKNKEWDTLQQNIQHLLEEIFKTGHQIRLPNPLYPNISKRDMIFKISQYIWKKRPHSSALGNYKFVISKNADDHLVVNIDVKLQGHFVKDAHQIGEPEAAPPAAKHFGERITRACDNHLKAVRELVSSYYASKKYKEMVARAEAEEAVAVTARRQTRVRRAATDFDAARTASQARAITRRRQALRRAFPGFGRVRQQRQRGRTAAAAAAAAARARLGHTGGGQAVRYKTRRRKRKMHRRRRSRRRR